LFVVGSSSIEAALAANASDGPARIARPPNAGPIVAVCGSRSPVTDAQIRWAVGNGFVEVSDLNNGAAPAVSAIRSGKSVVIHSRDVDRGARASIGPTLGTTLRDVLSSTKVRRVTVAGGDTSGAVAHALGIESMEMIAELTRGAPLVRVTAPNSPADGLEMTF